MPIKPERLNPGDTVAVVAPASPATAPANVDLILKRIDQLGFKPRLAPHARDRHGYLAGSDRDRAADLMRVFLDPKIQAVFCVRGGYGTARLLPLLDFDALRRHPKIFVGCSDITSLLCALLKKAELLSFHGPMLQSDCLKPAPPEFTRQRCWQTLMHPVAPGSICQGYEKSTVRVLRKGTVSGQLIGGNLSVLCASVGTPWEPVFRKRILFFEDVAEAPYRIDRMLTHLLNAGLLGQVAGIAVGVNHNCVDSKAAQSREYRQTVDDVLEERLLPLKVPVVTGLPFGHGPHNATLPLGGRATLDAVTGDLILTEAAVR